MTERRANPERLGAQYAPFAPAETEGVENADAETVEAEDALHREIREVEKGVSKEQREDILKEIHQENKEYLPVDDEVKKILGEHKIKMTAERKRWNELLKADAIREEVEEVLEKKSGKNFSRGEWDTLPDNVKKGFFEAKNVQDIIDILSGKRVIQRWFKGKGTKDGK